MPARDEGEATCIDAELYGQDSLLLRLTPASGERRGTAKANAARLVPVEYERRAAVTLSEPNVLLLDMAEYAFDGG